jgi:hypothetical protein
VIGVLKKGARHAPAGDLPQILDRRRYAHRPLLPAIAFEDDTPTAAVRESFVAEFVAWPCMIASRCRELPARGGGYFLMAK